MNLIKFLKHPLVLLTLLFGTLASGGAIKTWVAGEPLTAAQLNSAFQHIHSLMVGGHGPRLVNADVNSNANISTTKLERGSLIPVAAAKVYKVGAKDTACDATPCGFSGYGVASVAHFATGAIDVTLDTAISADAQVLVTVSRGATLMVECHPNINTTTSISVVSVYCKTFDVAGPTVAAADLVFSIVVLEP